MRSLEIQKEQAYKLIPLDDIIPVKYKDRTQFFPRPIVRKSIYEAEKIVVWFEGESAENGFNLKMFFSPERMISIPVEPVAFMKLKESLVIN